MTPSAPESRELLRRAGRLTDPVKISANWALLTASITLVTVAVPIFLAAIAMGTSEHPLWGLIALFPLVVLAGPWAIWLLLQPARRVPVFYLRAFRSDVQAEHLRRLLRTAIGQQFRLCGIRPPRERVSWLSRLLLTHSTGLRYLGSLHFDLEASDHNWMARLLASYAEARGAFIDVRDVTTHVADEIRLTYLALGPDRSVFITDSREPEAEARERIAKLLELPETEAAALKLLGYGEQTADEQFVMQAREVFGGVAAGVANVEAALPFATARVSPEGWKTHFWERNAGQLILGFLAVNAFLLIVPALLGLVSKIAAVVPLLVLSVALFVFYLRALRRSSKESAFSAQFRDITGEKHPPAYLRWARVLTVVWILTLLALPASAMLLPALARARDRAMRIACVNNLKQIGLSFRLWSNDNQEQFPFHVPVKDGGTLELCDRDADGFERFSAPHFQVMSNELFNPRILVCHGDGEKSPATDFSQLHASNVTYRVRTLPEVTETAPQEVLAVCPIHNTTLYTDGSVVQSRRRRAELNE